MAKYGKKASDKVEEKMHEMKQGKLRSGGSGKKVTNPKQAIAIGLSEARREGGFIEGVNALQSAETPWGMPCRNKPVMSFVSPDRGELKFDITAHTHRQISAHLKEESKLPKDHYDYLYAKHPDLLALTVNTLFRRHRAARLVRTKDGQARAFLSNRYRPIDNADVAEVGGPLGRQRLHLDR